MIELDQGNESEGAPSWIVTFADLMSLLLTFFVLMLSFSTMEVVKFRAAMSSIEAAFGLRSPEDVSDSPSGSITLDDDLSGITSADLEARLEIVLETTGLQAKAEAHEVPDGVMLRIEGDLMFPPGATDMSPEIFALLDDLATQMIRIDHRIDVIGHTDNTPISTTMYPSNWELSAARAGRAVRYLVQHGVPPERLRAIGQADTSPVVSNDTVQGRAHNRRVEFVFSARESDETPSIPPARPTSTEAPAQ